MSDLIISTLTQGLIYALLSYGVYITYSVLDFPDLTVDSCFPLGAAVTAILLLKGVDPWATLLCSAAAGAIAGLCTGLIHVRLGVRDLLAGIITMTALSSINLLIAGSNVTVERAVDTIFTSKGVMALFGNLTLGWRKLIISLVLAIVVKLLLDLYFRTKSGLLLRAVGDNGTLVTTLAQNKGNMKILGVVISNALVALCGSVLCQEQRSYSAVMGIGQVVFGLGFGVNRKRIDFYRAELASLGLGLEDKLDVKMGALSGGQRQAVALLMATMTPLNFLILDEHTAALDPKTAETIMVLTGKVVKEKKLTALMVTHNLRYAVEYGDRLLMLHHGQIVLDKAGEEKAKVTTEGLLEVFNRYSIL